MNKIIHLLFIVFVVFYTADSQNLRDLSYGSDVYVQPVPTAQPPTSTTKKSSFFGGIKKFFGRGSTTEAPLSIVPITQSSINTPSTPRAIQPTPSSPQQNQRDYINPAFRPDTHGTNIQGQSQNNRDVGQRDNNLNVKVSSTSPPSLIRNNFNSNPTILSTNQPQPQQQYNNGGRRDYVNPNLPASPTPSKGLLPGRNSFEQGPQPNINSNTKPNFVQSTSVPVIPSSSSTNTPTSGFPNLNNNRRDYVSPTSSIRPPTSPGSNILNTKDFPPLPSPGSPVSSHKGRFTTNSPNRPTSTQKTVDIANDEELKVLTETLFTKDINNQNKNVEINYQGKTRSSDTSDEAPQPLLQIKDEAFQMPTISKMRLLYNNYEMDTTVNEHVTAMERQEENDFIDTVLKTQVMRQAMLFLQNKGIVTPDPRTHKELLKTIWFTMYSRGGGRIGSSAFEHIFLNEIKNGTISGLHNWIYFYEQERQGLINYKGYMKKFDLGNKGAILKFRFDLNGVQKPTNAMFIGTSPELEMALYTVCFQVRPDKDCPITVNGNKFNLRTYTFRYRGKNLIGSAFPEI